ncbi:MAG: 30S ribosomal protein S6 [Verrucomicrobia bacterium]|nr:MAG: 30S ribosomal protein S6 [Verrucomicrobiota bacterium]
MKKYTATFILDTRSYQDPVENLIERLKGVMESVGCKIENVENMGQRAFARTTDKKFPAGIYVRIKFEGPASANSQIKEKLRLDKTVNRVLVLAD